MFWLWGMIISGNWGIPDGNLIGESLVQLCRWIPYLVLIRPEQIIPVDWRAGIKTPNRMVFVNKYKENKLSGKEA